MIFPDPSRTSLTSPILKRIAPPIQTLLIVFDTVAPAMREDLLVTVAVLSSRYIGVFVSKKTMSLFKKMGT